MTNKSDYERIEITFRKEDPEEMRVFDYILSKSGKIGKAKYIKNLIRKEMNDEASK